MADVRSEVVLPFATEFANYREFKPGDHQVPALTKMLDQLIGWSEAPAPIRAGQEKVAVR